MVTTTLGNNLYRFLFFCGCVYRNIDIELCISDEILFF